MATTKIHRLRLVVPHRLKHEAVDFARLAAQQIGIGLAGRAVTGPTLSVHVRASGESARALALRVGTAAGRGGVRS